MDKDLITDRKEDDGRIYEGRTIQVAMPKWRISKVRCRNEGTGRDDASHAKPTPRIVSG